MALKYNATTGTLEGTISGYDTDRLHISKTADDLKDAATPANIAAVQSMVYMLTGGGMLGSFGARQPADFYIDDRCGKMPGTRKQIYNAIAVLHALACAAGLNPHDLEDGSNLPFAGWILEP